MIPRCGAGCPSMVFFGVVWVEEVAQGLELHPFGGALFVGFGSADVKQLDVARTGLA